MDSDSIGEQGEAIFTILMSQLCHNNEPLFRPRFLGQKFPAFDHHVELTRRREFFFFVQVKATTLGYSKKDPKRLRIKCPRDKVDQMVAYPVPTYLVGINVPTKEGFIISVNERRPAIASLSTRHPLNCVTLQKLYHEIEGFWSQRDMALTDSYFTE